MFDKRIEIMNFVVTSGGKENLDLTWREILERFNIEGTEENLKRVSDWYRYYKRSGNITPDETLYSEELGETCGFSAPKGFKVKSVWGKDGNYQMSFTRDTENSIDVKEELKDFISKYSTKVEKLNLKSENKIPIAYEISIPDFHFGRVRTEEAVKLFLNSIVELVSRVSSGYFIEEFVLPVGNDFFNSDSVSYTTTKGTPQFDYEEWRELFRAGYKTILDVVNYLSQIAPVKIIMVPGNHDEQKTFYMGEVFEAFYRDNENVEVDNSLMSYKVWSYGVNAVMFDHGLLKENYIAVFATEFPKEFSNSKIRECHNGHIHVEVVKESRGVKTRFIPSIASRSDWEKKSGYKNLRTAQAFKWHKTKGLIGVENASIVE